MLSYQITRIYLLTWTSQNKISSPEDHDNDGFLRMDLEFSVILPVWFLSGFDLSQGENVRMHIPLNEIGKIERVGSIVGGN